MRIIAGNYRGKKLFAPAGQEVRPTGDKARESIFNILNNKIVDDWQEVKLLDVFAGTGAFALEAISRGAIEVCMVDKDIVLCSKNASLFPKEKNKIKLLKADALNLPLALTKYDIIFIDAPYEKGMSVKTLEQLKEKNWLNKNAVCIVEINKKEELILPSGFEQLDERIYGIAKFIFAQY